MGFCEDEGLNDVLAGWNVAKIVDRKTKVSVVDNGRCAGREPLDIAAEERDAGDLIELQPRLALAIACDIT